MCVLEREAKPPVIGFCCLFTIVFREVFQGPGQCGLTPHYLKAHLLLTQSPASLLSFLDARSTNDRVR